MTTPHKWTKEIHAFADGAVIENTFNNQDWYINTSPHWGDTRLKFRIKSAPMVQWLVVTHTGVVYAHPDTITEAREWHAEQVERRIMRLEIDPVTFAATCVPEDI